MSEITQEPQSSVEISISTKGVFSGSLKVYAKTSEEALATAKLKADELQTYIQGKNNLLMVKE